MPQYKQLPISNAEALGWPCRSLSLSKQSCLSQTNAEEQAGLAHKVSLLLSLPAYLRLREEEAQRTERLRAFEVVMEKALCGVRGISNDERMRD